MSGKHIAEHAFVRFDSVGNRYVCVCVCVCVCFPGQAMQFMMYALYYFRVDHNKLAIIIHFLWKNLNINFEFIDKELHLNNTYYPSPLV